MASSDEDLAGEPLIEDLDSSDHDAAKKSNKRKRRATDEGESKVKKAKDESGVNEAIGHMDPALLADHIVQKTKRFRPELSLVEMDDLSLPTSAILDTTSYTSPRTSEHLADFLETFVSSKAAAQKLSNAPTTMGSPHTIVIAAAGLRAADLSRALRKYQSKNIMVAKLFAKHIKLKEASESTKKTRMSIGVGTPQRLIDLLDNGSLRIDHLERIVIDASNVNQKKQGILDIKELQIPLTLLLTRAELKSRYSAEKHRVQLLFF